LYVVLELVLTNRPRKPYNLLLTGQCKLITYYNDRLNINEALIRRMQPCRETKRYKLHYLIRNRNSLQGLLKKFL